MGVTGIAVFAGIFAAAIRVESPIERHANGVAAIENGFYGKKEIFRALG
jgi:hypothetical protein